MSTVIVATPPETVVITESSLDMVSIQNPATLTVEITEQVREVVTMSGSGVPGIQGPPGPAGNVEVLWGTTPEPASTAYPTGSIYFQY